MKCTPKRRACIKTKQREADLKDDKMIGLGKQAMKQMSHHTFENLKSHLANTFSEELEGCQLCIYWSRPAAGLKLLNEPGISPKLPTLPIRGRPRGMFA